MIGSRTWAQWYALAFGAALVLFASVVALLGAVALGAQLFHEHIDLNEPAFGISHWHHLLLYAIAGVLGLATWRRADSARVYALTFGAVFLAFAVLGFIHRDWQLWVTSAALVYDIVSATIGVAGLVCGLVSPRHRIRTVRAPTTV